VPRSMIAPAHSRAFSGVHESGDHHRLGTHLRSPERWLRFAVGERSSMWQRSSRTCGGLLRDLRAQCAPGDFRDLARYGGGGRHLPPRRRQLPAIPGRCRWIDPVHAGLLPERPPQFISHSSSCLRSEGRNEVNCLGSAGNRSPCGIALEPTTGRPAPIPRASLVEVPRRLPLRRDIDRFRACFGPFSADLTQRAVGGSQWRRPTTRRRWMPACAHSPCSDGGCVRTRQWTAQQPSVAATG
jgi:hypothetical protein